MATRIVEPMDSNQRKLETFKSLAENWDENSEIEIFRTFTADDLVQILEQRIIVIQTKIEDTTLASSKTANEGLKAKISKDLTSAKQFASKQQAIRLGASAPPFENKNPFKTLHREVRRKIKGRFSPMVKRG